MDRREKRTSQFQSNKLPIHVLNINQKIHQQKNGDCQSFDFDPEIFKTRNMEGRMQTFCRILSLLQYKCFLMMSQRKYFVFLIFYIFIDIIVQGKRDC